MANFGLELLATDHESESVDSNKITLPIIIVATATICAVTSIHCLQNMPSNRVYSAEGQRYVRSLLECKSDKAKQNCRKVYRMNQDCFQKFSEMLRSKALLRDIKSVSVEEQVAMFLVTVGQNQRYGMTQERFTRSSWSVSTYFNKVLNAIIQLRDELLVRPSSTTPARILEDSTMYPYFQDCVGAIDGTYINATIYNSENARFRNRKGDLSQNVMAACNFDMEFIYVLAGWEGSAADSRVLQDALSRSCKLEVPEGKYYLVDAGYPNRPEFLSPYRGVRYHLSEYDSNNLPRNAEELFNHRHSRLRNVIERLFGVVKARFPILNGSMPFPYETQVKVVIACCLVHNYIRREDREDEWEEIIEEEDGHVNIINEDDVDVGDNIFGGGMTISQMRAKANRARNGIAKDMWEDK